MSVKQVRGLVRWVGFAGLVSFACEASTEQDRAPADESSSASPPTLTGSPSAGTSGAAAPAALPGEGSSTEDDQPQGVADTSGSGQPAGDLGARAEQTVPSANGADVANAQDAEPMVNDATPLDEAGTNDPAIDDPASDDPAIDDPAIDDAASDDTAIDDPAIDDAASDDTAIDDPAIDDPATVIDAVPPEDDVGSAACASMSQLGPGDSTRSITVGGMSREFVLHVPASYTGSDPMPVVIDFHPLGGTGSSWRGSTGWDTKSDAEGFIMVWPTGVGNSWNVGRCCSTARSSAVDDVAFTRAIIDSLASEGCIDRKRVYASGCSNGGGMAYRVACEAADVIAAVAPVDFDCVVGPEGGTSCGGCEPDRPISTIQFRGTNDTAVPYAGGAGPRGEVVFPGAESNFSEWGEINQCTGAPTAASEQPSCQTYQSCAEDAETTLCTVQNGAHCGSYASFGIVDLAWAGFLRAALP